MTWTEEDERKFQERRAEHFRQLEEEDRENEREAQAGRRKRCYQCGSHRYQESIRAESCPDCGLSQGYP